MVPRARSADVTEGRPELAPRSAKPAAGQHGLAMLLGGDAVPVVDPGNRPAVVEQRPGPPVGPHADEHSGRPVVGRGPPVPVAVVAGVDRRQAGAEELEGANTPAAAVPIGANPDVWDTGIDFLCQT